MKNFRIRFSSLLILTMIFGFAGTAMGQVTSDDAWINEFHYDNTSTDVGEFVEVVIKDAATYTLSDFTLTEYNGNDSSKIDSHTLDGFTEGETIGEYTFYHKLISGLQNGPDGFALDHQGTLIQFLSYEGSFTAIEGVANGQAATDVGVDESSASEGESLQLTGSGYAYSDFSWSGPSIDSPGSPNDSQFLYPTVQFSSASASVNEADGTITIPVKILNPDGNAVDVDVIFQQNISTAETGDFTTSTTQTVSFGSGASDSDTLNASFTLDSDTDYEGEEVAEFKLSNISTSGSAKIDGQTTYSLTIEDNETPNVVINEINPDPGSDANGDGSTNTESDEFVEILNLEGKSIDIGGWVLVDKVGTIHEFTENTILQANSAAVIFDDSGTPNGSFGGSIVVTSSSDLSLNNSSEKVVLLTSNSTRIDSVEYTTGPSKVSLVRDPDGTGAFVDHDEATGSSGAVVSPGTKIDGSLFTTSLVIEGNAGWRMLSAPVENMAISEITDDTPIQGFGDGHAKNFYDGYSGSAFTAPSDLTGNLTSGEGFILYFYNNTDASSSTLPVVIDVGSNSEPSSDVNVEVHSAGNGWNLLGNPYQTAFDITSISPTSGSLASAVAQIWSDEDESYILSSANNDKVAPGQGFFLQNTDAPSVDLPTSGKATGTQFYKEAHQKAFVQLALISEGSNGEGTQRDLSTMLYFHDEAGLDWDKWDAEKIYPLKSNYSLLNIVNEENEKVKAQDSRVFENLGDEIFQLNVESMNVNANQVLEWNRSSNIPDEWIFNFTDNVTGKETIMDENFSYSFNQDEISLSSDKSAAKLSKSLSVVNNPDEKPRFTITVNKGKTTNIDQRSEIPEQFTLEQNYPNPFNPTTSIQYSVAEAGDVSLTIYNVMGQKVETLVNGTKAAGTYRISWDAANMASGIYYYSLHAGNQVLTRQMTLIK